MVDDIYLDQRDEWCGGRRKKKWEGESEVENWEELEEGGRQISSHHPTPPVDGVGPEKCCKEGKGAVEREEDERAKTLIELSRSQPLKAACRQDAVVAHVHHVVVVVVQLVVHHPAVHSACCLRQH